MISTFQPRLRAVEIFSSCFFLPSLLEWVFRRWPSDNVCKQVVVRQALGPLNMYEITKESQATATTVLLDIYRMYFRDGVCAILYGLENFEDLVAPATYQEGVVICHIYRVSAITGKVEKV